MSKNKKIEIACFNIESALIAQKAGADRVELCDGIEVGGTTPNLETVRKVRQILTIDLFVMIRPRGGNFVYSGEEIEKMIKDFEKYREQDEELIKLSDAKNELEHFIQSIKSSLENELKNKIFIV